MFTIRCARCGKIILVTMVHRLVSFDGKRRRWVCSDDRQCWPKDKYKVRGII